MGGGVMAALSGIGTGVKAMGSDMLGGAKNAFFGVQHPTQMAQNGAPNDTGAYDDTTMGKFFGAGQPQQQTAAQRNRMIAAQS